MKNIRDKVITAITERGYWVKVVDEDVYVMDDYAYKEKRTWTLAWLIVNWNNKTFFRLFSTIYLEDWGSMSLPDEVQVIKTY